MTESILLARIIVADDDENLRNMLDFCLESQGFEIVGAVCNGKEACQLYESVQPDAVILDIRMPIMDGITALKKIRCGDPTAIVIIITGYLEDAYRKQAEAAGAAGFIEKPFKIETLAGEINGFLQRSGKFPQA